MNLIGEAETCEPQKVYHRVLHLCNSSQATDSAKCGHANTDKNNMAQRRLSNKEKGQISK
jgi:hypothetical protein